MDVTVTAVPDALVLTPRIHRDDRGAFLEWFTTSSFEAATGHPLSLAQANCSVSRRGALRGLHFADVPPGQAKYVTCVSGSVLDVVVDLRVGSPTFGVHDTVLLDTVDRRAVYLPEGLGHGFLALEDDSTVVYLCSEGYDPDREHEVDPMDPELGIAWPEGIEPVRSEKDRLAPSLAEVRERGGLPDYAACTAYVRGLRA